MNLNRRLEAISDAMKIRAGVVGKTYAEHPKAREILNGSEPLFAVLADAISSSAHPDGRPTRVQGLGGMLVTQDFEDVLGDFLRTAFSFSFVGHLAHRSFVAMRTLRDYREHRASTADLSFDMSEELAEHQEARSIVSVDTMLGNLVRLRRYGRDLAIARRVIVNDDLDLLAGYGTAGGATAARLEAAAVYALMESNPTLGDSSPMFHADFGNIVAAALDAAGLGSALGALRKTPMADAAPSNLDAAFLVVEPTLELTARTLVKDAGLNVAVISSAWLGSGRWYLLAAPEVAPVVALFHLEGHDRDISVNRIRLPANSSFDGVLLGIRYEFGVTAVGRAGVVRGGA